MADDEQRGAKDAGASAPETDAKGGGDNPQEAASERVIIARKWEGAPSVADPKGEKGGPVAVYWYDGERERRGAWPREATRELHFHAVRADTVDGEATLGLALAASAWHGDQEGIADLLHQRGANATWADANGATPMHQAAARGDLGGTKILLDRGGDVNAVDASLRTGLHLAARGGHGALVKLLLDAGADAAMVDGQGESAQALAEGAKNQGCALLIKRRLKVAAAGSASSASSPGLSLRHERTADGVPPV